MLNRYFLTFVTLQFGQMQLRGIGEVETTSINQHHRRNGREWLGDGSEQKLRIRSGRTKGAEKRLLPSLHLENCCIEETLCYGFLDEQCCLLKD